MSEKIFLVINLSFFGDVLLSNGLIRNIKLNYPESKVIFIVNSPYKDAALYQDGVDEVFCFDKNGKNKGFWGLLKFVFKFPYRNKIFTSFAIYGNERAALLAFLLGSKNRIAGDRIVNYLFSTKIHKNKYQNEGIIYNNADLIRSLNNKEAEKIPIKYNVELIEDETASKMALEYQNHQIIGICCISKKLSKNMSIDIAAEVINRLNNDKKTVFFFGNESKTEQYALELEKKGCKFINLVNKTSIKSLAKIISICQGVISIDTGTMHLTYAMGIPLVAVFYLKDYIRTWAPDTKIYNAAVLADNCNAENIVNSLYSVINKQNTAV